MTNAEEPFAPAPPLGYWTEHLDSRALRSKARNRGELRAVDEFILKVNAAADVIAKPHPDPRVRAEGYRNKPVELWAEQYIFERDDFMHDWADWERIDPGHLNLQAVTMEQIEAKLGEAGVELEDDDRR